ncbi:MAG: Maf family nucleotide pyrophosphatase [Bacteroidota bacterium]
MIQLKQPLILASKSPRRQHLLKEANIPFIVKTKSIDETFPSELDLAEVAAYIAKDKAEAASIFLEDENDILLTADSVVATGNHFLAKPEGAEDAKRMLRILSGRMHYVYTGVCIKSKAKEEVFTGTSKVYMNELTEAEIDFYIDQFQPYDKAGSYAIQEWIGLCKISKIEGTYANIMGLPVDLVYQCLLNW